MSRIALIASAILIGSVSNAPSASAAIAGEAANIVESVDAVANAAPQLPSATPPPPPAPPPLPAAPQAPVKSRPEAAPKPSPSPPGPDVIDVPSPTVKGVVGAARESPGSAADAGEEMTRQATASARARIDASRDSTPPSDPDAGAGKATSLGSGSGAPPSIAPAEVAALQRWFARIWPAISLGGGVGGGAPAAGMVDLLLLRPAAAAVARLLSLAPAVAQAPGGSPSVGHSDAAKDPRSTLPDAAGSPDGQKTIYLVVFAALLAVLAFTIWKEFRSTLRPGVR
jgi:hypothetical protein